MTEYVVTAVEQTRELIVRICEVFEAVLPQSHVLEAAERFFVALNPIWGAERHQQKDSADIRNQGTDDERV